MDIIDTQGDTGSPGYVDDNAPKGNQWLTGTPLTHTKVPEGAKVFKTGKANDYDPPYIEINILDGQYAGTKGIWVKSTHVATVEDPVTPPTPPPADGEYAWVVDVQAKITIRKTKVEG